ncbi:hypothetical protein [Streptomyces sp. NPDC054784]
MTGGEDELLASELGALGGPASAWVARRLGDDVHEREVVCRTSMADTLVEIRALVATVGQVVEESGAPGGRATVRLVMGSGALNLNPAVVTMTVSSLGDAGTRVHLRGVAKEGLIKQRAGRKAVERLAALLTRATELGGDAAEFHPSGTPHGAGRAREADSRTERGSSARGTRRRGGGGGPGPRFRGTRGPWPG